MHLGFSWEAQEAYEEQENATDVCVKKHSANKLNSKPLLSSGEDLKNDSHLEVIVHKEEPQQSMCINRRNKEMPQSTIRAVLLSDT